MRRDRGARRPRASDLPDREPCAHRVHRAEALWLRRHEPDVYARIRRILLPKDYVRLRLTGVHAIDAADASGTLLFDVAARRWSDEVLEALEIPQEWLPPVSESTGTRRGTSLRHRGRRSPGAS